MKIFFCFFLLMMISCTGSASIEEVADLYGKGKLKESLAEANILIKKNPKDEQALIYKAKIQYREGKYNEALDIFNQVIEQNPKAAEAYQYRGYTYGLLKQQDKADIDYIQYVKLSTPEHNWPVADLTAQKEYGRLLITDSFDSAAVGVAGTPSENVKSLRYLFKLPEADTIFKSLLTHGKLAGQLYALMGLYVTDNAFFKDKIKSYQNMSGAIKGQDGCTGGEDKIADIADGMTKGESPRFFLGM